jgi:hypothetical protein
VWPSRGLVGIRKERQVDWVKGSVYEFGKEA